MKFFIQTRFGLFSSLSSVFIFIFLMRHESWLKNCNGSESSKNTWNSPCCFIFRLLVKVPGAKAQCMMIFFGMSHARDAKAHCLNCSGRILILLIARKSQLCNFRCKCRKHNGAYSRPAICVICWILLNRKKKKKERFSWDTAQPRDCRHRLISVD